MGVIGARHGDVAACLAGNQDACERVAWGYFVFPHIQRVFEELKLMHPPDPIIPRPPFPDPPPYLGEELISVLLAPAFGDPSPQPNLVDARLNALKKTLNGLDDLKSGLESEIERVSELSEAGSEKKYEQTK